MASLLKGLKHERDGWFTSNTHCLFCHAKWTDIPSIPTFQDSNTSFQVFLLIFLTQQYIFQQLLIVLNNPLPPPPPAPRKVTAVNVCKHNFPCTNVTRKTRNGRHLIPHALTAHE